MSNGAATEQDLGTLHSKLTKMFLTILKGYDTKLQALDKLTQAVIDDDEDIGAILVEANIEPSPAMLSAISKFLKDNEITVDSAELDKLSAHEERLKNKKANRPNLASITNLKVVAK